MMATNSPAASVALNGERTAPEAFAPSLGGERVVEGVHYGWLMRDHIARYRFAAEYCRGKRVLDVATGTGYGANILRQRGAKHVVAVDREKHAVEYAASRYGTSGLDWMSADAYSLPFASEFDVVVSFETIEHLTDPQRFVAECRRVLKPGGIFLVSTPLNMGGPYVSDFHELEFSREEFEATLRQSFPRINIFGQRRELATRFKPLGDFPTEYWNSYIRHGRGNHRFFTFIDRMNKAPNLACAWALGVGERFRSQILPLDEPVRRSAFLRNHYYVMIAVCAARALPAKPTSRAS